MAARRARTLTRTMHHLRGWRLAVLALAPLGSIVILLVFGHSIGEAIGLTAAALIPAYAVLLLLAVDTARSIDHLERIIGPGRRIETDMESVHRRLHVIDSVLSAETRRPWEPTTLPFHFVAGRDPKPILLLPGADYHLPEIIAIADELDSRDIPSVVAVGRPHWERTGDGLIWYDKPIYETPALEDIPGNFSALVTMKDWAGYAPLVEAANDVGIPTFAKVEGAQDFHDVDTNQPRRPYRTARHILCQGQNDYDALEGMDRTIVGSTRLERLWWAPPANPPSELAVINLNFTYGVLTEARDLFLRTAVEGCEAAGVPYIISVHPAERARNPHPKVTSVSASRLLRHATVLISRFSTLPFEAMARGVPFVYHNPHEEFVPTFKDPLGAFLMTGSSNELASVIETIGESRSETRARSERFLRKQILVETTSRCEERTVDTVLSTS